MLFLCCFFFQAEDGIRDAQESRGLGDVYKRQVVKTAYKRKYIKDDLTDETQTITMVETHKKYLTLDELNKLAKTDCRYPVLKRAALFSALTGLRFSDILKLKWGEIEVENDNYQIRFRQQKTKGVEVLPISQQAVDLLGAAGEVGEQVFSGLKSCLLYTSPSPRDS